MVFIFKIMVKDTRLQVKNTLNIGGELMDLSEPMVMGIINITPDSFFSGSRVNTNHEILKQAEKMLAEGADFLDLGAYSSRPGAQDISEAEEEARLLPAVTLISKEFKQAFVSIDTFRAGVAEKAIHAGAHIVNDISGGNLDLKMFETVGKLKVPYILMHMKGTPQNMQSQTHYEDMMEEMMYYFSTKIQQLKAYGVHDIMIDPGFGFAKDITQNFSLLKHLATFKILGFPVLAGLSRKSMIWKTLNTTAEEALNGTTVLNTLALQNGAAILRVHDVKAAKESISLYQTYLKAQ